MPGEERRQLRPRERGDDPHAPRPYPLRRQVPLGAGTAPGHREGVLGMGGEPLAEEAHQTAGPLLDAPAADPEEARSGSGRGPAAPPPDLGQRLRLFRRKGADEEPQLAAPARVPAAHPGELDRPLAEDEARPPPATGDGYGAGEAESGVEQRPRRGAVGDVAADAEIEVAQLRLDAAHHDPAAAGKPRAGRDRRRLDDVEGAVILGEALDPRGLAAPEVPPARVRRQRLGRPRPGVVPAVAQGRREVERDLRRAELGRQGGVADDQDPHPAARGSGSARVFHAGRSSGSRREEPASSIV